MKNFLSICLAVAFLALSGCSDKNATSLTHWVDPYIGTGGHGHTFLGVAAPFGALQLGPTNINKGWDWCSGYHYSDSVLIGFSHLHLNGTGCCDSGDLLFMPYTGKSYFGLWFALFSRSGKSSSRILFGYVERL